MWVGIIYAGTSLGTVISILSSGMIMNNLGWKAVYYIHGTLPLIWCFIFFLFFADCPEEQKYISEEERQLLIKSYGHRSPGSVKVKVPWKAILTSKPFWALIWTNTLGNFCWYFLLTQMPLFMNKILRFPITSVRHYIFIQYFGFFWLFTGEISQKDCILGKNVRYKSFLAQGSIWASVAQSYFFY